MAVQDFLQRLTDERARAFGEQRGILDKALAEGRSELTAEERQVVERTDEAMDRLDGEIKGWISREERAREADEARAQYERFLTPADQAEHRAVENDVNAEVLAFLAGERRSIKIDLRPVAREKAALRAGATGAEFRTHTVGTAASGGTTVPITFARTLYDFLEIYTGTRRLNPTIITTASGEQMEFPRVTAHGTAALTAEGSAFAAADAAFDRMSLNAYKYGQLVQVSSELIADTGVDVLGFVARDCARALARVTDTAYVKGSGSNQPQGFTGVAGTATTSVVGGTGVPNYGNLVDTIYGINEEYRVNGKWFTLDANVGKIRKLTDSQNRPLWEPSLQVGGPDRLLGYPIVTDPNMAAFATAAKGMAFGDWSALYIRDVGSVRFERSDDYAFDKDLVTFRSVIRTDSDVIDLNAIKLLVGGSA